VIRVIRDKGMEGWGQPGRRVIKDYDNQEREIRRTAWEKYNQG
jgi:hypothetical protein